MEINYNNRIFRSKSNTETGDVDRDTIFDYQQDGNILKATYSGGQISAGQMLGIVNPDSSLDFAYHHINNHGELKTGKCHSKPELLPDGRIRLHESWEWLDDGERLSGTSVIEEMST